AARAGGDTVDARRSGRRVRADRRGRRGGVVVTRPSPVSAAPDPAEEAAAVVEAVLADLPRHRGVVVDSPPGAGKSTLVVRAAGHIAATGEPLMIVAQTNEQVDDLVDRLVVAHPDLTVG